MYSNEQILNRGPADSLPSQAKVEEQVGGQQQQPATSAGDAPQLVAQSKRKEKARIAARARRSQEANFIMDMAVELHISQEKLRRIDKATIVKLAIDYIRAHGVLCAPGPHQPEPAEPLAARHLRQTEMIDTEQLKLAAKHDTLAQDDDKDQSDEGHQTEPQANQTGEREREPEPENQENSSPRVEEEEEAAEQPLYSAPKLTTASIFEPKTSDNANSYFLMIEKEHDGKAAFVLKPDTEIQDEDDLTHLAPQAGDISISFETDSLDSIPLDDLLMPSPVQSRPAGQAQPAQSPAPQLQVAPGDAYELEREDEGGESDEFEGPRTYGVAECDEIYAELDEKMYQLQQRLRQHQRQLKHTVQLQQQQHFAREPITRAFASPAASWGHQRLASTQLARGQQKKAHYHELYQPGRVGGAQQQQRDYTNCLNHNNCLDRSPAYPGEPRLRLRHPQQYRPRHQHVMNMGNRRQIMTNNGARISGSASPPMKKLHTVSDYNNIRHYQQQQQQQQQQLHFAPSIRFKQQQSASVTKPFMTTNPCDLSEYAYNYVGAVD